MDFADFLPHVLPSAPGCPDQVAIDHVRKAAREFCDRTRCWSVTDQLRTYAGQTVYPLPVDDQIERVRLLGVSVDGRLLCTADAAQGRAWADRDSGGEFAFLDNPTDLVIRPKPIQGGAPLSVRVALRPSLLATEWPDELTEFVPEIANGAIATLMLLPNQSWSNPTLSQYHRSIFMERAAVAGINVGRGFQGRTYRRSRFL